MQNVFPHNTAQFISQIVTDKDCYIFSKKNSESMGKQLSPAENKQFRTWAKKTFILKNEYGSDSFE